MKMTLREMVQTHASIGITYPSELQDIQVFGINQISEYELAEYLRSLTFFLDTDKCFWEYIFSRDHENLFFILSKDDKGVHLQFSRKFFEDDDDDED